MVLLGTNKAVALLTLFLGHLIGQGESVSCYHCSGLEPCDSVKETEKIQCSGHSTCMYERWENSEGEALGIGMKGCDDEDAKFLKCDQEPTIKEDLQTRAIKCYCPDDGCNKCEDGCPQKSKSSGGGRSIPSIALPVGVIIIISLFIGIV